LIGLQLFHLFDVLFIRCHHWLTPFEI